MASAAQWHQPQQRQANLQQVLQTLTGRRWHPGLEGHAGVAPKRVQLHPQKAPCEELGSFRSRCDLGRKAEALEYKQDMRT